jgi:hypothetical protein
MFGGREDLTREQLGWLELPLEREALDRNFVAISSKYGDIPRLVYGTLKGALGWERWIEGKVHLHQGGEWAGTRDMKCLFSNFGGEGQ